VAVVLGLWTSFAAGVLFGNSFPVFTMGLVVTTLAAHSAQSVRKRSGVFRAGLWVGLGQMLFALGLAALNQPDLPVVLWQAAGSLVTGLVVAGVTLLLTPLFEVLFGITTDITLLEYSDSGHPLLQRLAKEAPGTYHHSLMVADLGRAAAEAIGANAMLVRVCALFHDVGKLTKPEFFIENQQYISNPHDALEPSMSTLVIIAHVKEGVALGQQHKLPQPIIDGIRQHHGTSLITYFYHRARKQKEEGEGERILSGGTVLNEGDFRYEGPKPANREMGILLLADSVEAASRSMAKPTANRIEALIHDIVEARLRDHQLDESGLTLSELWAIERSLVFSVTSMLHVRTEYPKDEARGKQPAKSSARPVQDSKPDPAHSAEPASA
jgi:putative nucleotidyltransferase with HDIG domain